jgi:hypothetical protein
MEPIRKIISGSPELVRTINLMIDSVNAFQRLTGDGLVQVQKTGLNVSLKLDINRINGLLPKAKGASAPVFAVVVKDIKLDDETRVFPAGCTWGTPDDPWVLSGQKEYIVLLLGDDTEIYDDGETYDVDDYCIFEILADTSPMIESYAEVGYGYQLKYKCKTAVTSPEAFQYTKWELVDDYAEGQWEIDRAFSWDETSLKRVGEDSGDTNDIDLRNHIPWFEVGSTIPIKNYTLDDDGSSSETTTYHLFAQTFIYVDEAANSSISWNQEDSRAMCIFR